MKTIAYITALLCVLTGCKKSYTCDCTTTVTFSNHEPYQSKSSEPIGQKTTLSQAQAICRSAEEQLNDHFSQQLADPKVSSTSTANCAVQ